MPVSNRIDKSQLALPEPRRFRDKTHCKFVSTQPCLICGRQPADAHHLRFAQHPALGRKVSDEFIVPLCRGHHREVHRSGDEAHGGAKPVSTPLALLGHFGPRHTRFGRLRKPPTLISQWPREQGPRLQHPFRGRPKAPEIAKRSQLSVRALNDLL